MVTSMMHSSEEIIGCWLKSSGNRSHVVLQTKATTNFPRQHVQDAIDASLERLQADWIDLYLFHSFDSKTPLEDGTETLSRTVEQEEIRAGGCNNFSAVMNLPVANVVHGFMKRLDQALLAAKAFKPMTAVQVTRLLDKTRPAALEGKLGNYKQAQYLDSRVEVMLA